MEYKTIEEKIIPTIYGKEIGIAYIKVMKEDNGAAASAFSSTFNSTAGSPSEYHYAIMVIDNNNNISENVYPKIMSGEFTDDYINSTIEKITDGMKESNKEAVRASIENTNNSINLDLLIDIEWTQNEKDLLRESATKIFADLEEMKKNIMSGAASDGKLLHYAFRKHLLIQGEKGGLGFQATIAA